MIKMEPRVEDLTYKRHPPLQTGLLKSFRDVIEQDKSIDFEKDYTPKTIQVRASFGPSGAWVLPSEYFCQAVAEGRADTELRRTIRDLMLAGF